jgi:hypothetical protein
MSKVISQFLKSGVEPFPDSIYGVGFRCSVYLTDGTYLPCVMLRSATPLVDLAVRRFEEEKRGRGIFRSDKTEGYKTIVSQFVASGNHVNHYDIAKVEPSRYAIPLSLLRQIEGETTMSWTGFALEMNDGKCFAFGTTFLTEFFNLPDGYAFADVARVHNHSYVSQAGDLRPINQGMSPQPPDYDASQVYRERPYFVCHHDA